jgi:hypothetical protein
MARKSGSGLLGGLTRIFGYAINGAVTLAGEATIRGADKTRKAWHNVRHRYDGFRTRQEMNARFLRDYGGYWQGKAGKAMRRKLGRDQDLARRHARSHREAFHLADHRGRATDKSRSRPDLPSRPRLKDLREQHRHHRDHEKADTRDRKAQNLRAKGKHDRAARHERVRDELRGRWPARQPAAPRTTQPPRTAPDRTDDRPPARLPARPLGRLAPQSAPARMNGNGHMPARIPARPGRTP